MYGSFYHLHPMQGQEQAVLDHLFRWEQDYLPCVTGYVGGYVFESVSAPGDIVVIVVFDSQADYTRTRDDPEQERLSQNLQELLEYDSEWNEGEITEIMGELQGL